MRTSPSISNLSKALLVAQKQMEGAVKGSKNPFFKSSYADLPTVMEVVKGPLNDVGIIVLQPATTINGKNYISTTLIHGETGEFISSDIEIVSKNANSPQDFGAATTYARRFGLQSMLFIPAEDDDGETAMGRGKAKAAPVVAVPASLPVPANPQTLNLTSNGSGGTVPAASLPVNTVVSNTVTEVKPLKTSNFRNPKKAAATPAPAADSGWGD